MADAPTPALPDPPTTAEPPARSKAARSLTRASWLMFAFITLPMLAWLAFLLWFISGWDGGQELTPAGANWPLVALLTAIAVSNGLLFSKAAVTRWQAAGANPERRPLVWFPPLLLGTPVSIITACISSA